MTKASDLSDDLLVKILSYLPTKVAVSTCILSKQWEFLWMWLPKLEYNAFNDILAYHSESSIVTCRDFISKNLPLHRAPIIESLLLRFRGGSVQPEDIKSWAGIAISRYVRELSIHYLPFYEESAMLLLPSSLYNCKTLVTLKLRGNILVDVPPMVCLPSVKILQLEQVTYSNEDSLRLLLSYCTVLEDLTIERDEDDNVRALVVIVPSLQCLSLCIENGCSSDGYVIVTPSLKYFQVVDLRESFSYLIEPMPELEEADIYVDSSPEKLLVSITSVKRLTLHVLFNKDIDPVYHSGIAFNQLQQLNLTISNNDWSKLLVRLLKDSPKLQILNLDSDDNIQDLEEYESVSWLNDLSSVPKCLLKSLETFEFEGYEGRPEERDFLIYIFKHARCLKSRLS